MTMILFFLKDLTIWYKKTNELPFEFEVHFPCDPSSPSLITKGVWFQGETAKRRGLIYW